MNQIFIIIRREYVTRVRTKAFILTSILMPVFFSLIMFLPGYFAEQNDEDTSRIGLVDHTGWMSEVLVQNKLVLTPLPASTFDQIRSMINKKKVDGVVEITGEKERPISVRYYYNKRTSSSLIKKLEAITEKAMLNKKLTDYGVKNPAQLLAQVKQNAQVDTVKVQNPTDKSDNDVIRYIVAVTLGLFIYMLIFLFSSQVMQGVLEEKTNRIAEVIITTVSPIKFMIGKIVGIALLGITQIGIWIVLGCGLLFYLSVGMHLTPGGFSEFLSQGAIHILVQIGLLKIIIGFVLLFICGYLLYSSIFAVVGVTVNHHDEMQQMSMLVGLPLIIAIIVLTVDTVNNPDSTLSFWLSMIPFTSPVVMMGRLAFGAPTGELIISIAILLVTMIGMMWLAGKIYRGMILYTGKKVGVKDAIEWLQRSLTSKKNE